MEPNRDLTRDPQTCNPLTVSRKPIYGRTDSVASLSQPVNEGRSGSRTDMSTGQRSIHRGFDFSTEENGVAIRRMQTNLSERRQSSRNLAEVSETATPHRRRDTISHVLAAPRNFLRRKA
jgi:phospholipid-translocating ATPase